MGTRQAAPRRSILDKTASRLQREWSQRWQGSVPAATSSLVLHLVLLLVLACFLITYPESTTPDLVTVSFGQAQEVEFIDPIEELDGQVILESPDRIVPSAAMAPILPEESTAVLPVDVPLEIASTEGSTSEVTIVQPVLVPVDREGRRGDGARSAGGAGITDDWNFPAGAGYEGRLPGNRTQLALINGGMLASERAVEAGLEWLARHQQPDGAWSFQHLHVDCGSDCTGPGTIDGSTAATGLALLSFLGAGYTHHDDSQYQETVERGLEWLTAQSRVGDLRCAANQITPERHTGMYAQGIATMALCEAVGMTHDRLYRDDADAAVQFIVDSQDRYGGGWRYEPNEPGDTSVLGWQVLALVSARMSGLEVPDTTRENTVAFLESVYNSSTNRFGYTSRSRSTWGTTAIGQLCSMYLRSSLSPERLRPDVSQLATTNPRTNDSYANYYISQVLHQFGDTWQSWSDRLRDHLVESQRTDGHAAGSWDTRGRWSGSGGRLYMTAMHVLTLEVYYRHLPLYERRAFDILQPELVRDRRRLMPAEGRNRGPRTREDDEPIAAIEPTPLTDSQPETLAGLDCPTRYILNYPTADRFCGPIPSTFEDAERDFATNGSGRIVGQHINGGFGLPLLQIGEVTHFHTGADYGWHQGGESVHAVAAGIVRLSIDFQSLQPSDATNKTSSRRQQLMDWGSTVIIEHRLPDGEYVTTLYAHLGLDRQVRTGDIVAAGQQIGTIGHKFDTANEDHTQHLHFGVREGRIAESGATLFTLTRMGQTLPVKLHETGKRQRRFSFRKLLARWTERS